MVRIVNLELYLVLYDWLMSVQRSSGKQDWATFNPVPFAGSTLMRAHFRQHAFERHSHETYSIGLTHTGVQSFRCGGTLHASLPGGLILFNPDEAHDGQRGAPEGFGYSILYLPQSAIEACLGKDSGVRLPLYFRSPVVRDPALAHLFETATAALLQPSETLRAEVLLDELVSRTLMRHGEAGVREVPKMSRASVRAEKTRDYLHANFCENVTMQDLVAVSGLSRAHLVRAFVKHCGVPPHVYLNAVRIQRAKAAMLAGTPLGEVAQACGFADQSHLTRRFKGAVGIPPGNWSRQIVGKSGKENSEL